MGSLTLGAAFGAGFLSFLSPCVLPMLPTFLLLLAGSGAEKEQGRGGLLLNTLAFLGGFTLVFLTMGATATLVGQLVLQYWKVLEKLAGALLILLGLFLSGLWTPLFLLRDWRPFLQQKKQGVLGSFLLGAAFTLGWTPCTGPILTGILMSAGSRQTVQEGVFLLLAYALGFCVPFLLAALFWEKIGPHLRRHYAWLPRIQKILGLFLVLFGLLMISGMALRVMAVLAG